MLLVLILSSAITFYMAIKFTFSTTSLSPSQIYDAFPHLRSPRKSEEGLEQGGRSCGWGECSCAKHRKEPHLECAALPRRQVGERTNIDVLWERVKLF